MTRRTLARAAAAAWALAAVLAAPAGAQTDRAQRHRVPAEFMSYLGPTGWSGPSASTRSSPSACSTRWA